MFVYSHSGVCEVSSFRYMMVGRRILCS